MMRRWLAALVAVGMAVAGVAAVAPAASAQPTTCSVVNNNTRANYTDLQSAVNAATAGDELVVRGTCTRTAPDTGTLVNKDLTITGRANSPTLSGGGVARVLTIAANVSVTLEKLIIKNGHTTSGGGINNRGTVTLKNSTVTGNTATVLTGNGGGIYTQAPGTVTMNSSNTVTGNSAVNGGGVYILGGMVTMNGGSTVTGNTASRSGNSGLGGGIYMAGAASIVTMNGGSRVSGNVATVRGGGIFISSGSRLVGAVCGRDVRDNTPDNVSPPIPGQSGC